MLSEGQTYEATAQAVGVARRTIDRWLLKPHFQQAIADIRAKTLESVGQEQAEKYKAYIQKLVPVALNVLKSTLTTPTARPSDKLRACQIIGNWAGLNQVAIAKPQQQPAEENLKDYLSYLSNKNGNTNGSDHHLSVRG